MTLEISKSCLTFFSLSSYYSSYSCSSCSCSSSFCVLQEKHAVKLNFTVHKPQAALMLSTLMEKEATNLSQSIVTWLTRTESEWQLLGMTVKPGLLLMVIKAREATCVMSIILDQVSLVFHSWLVFWTCLHIASNLLSMNAIILSSCIRAAPMAGGYHVTW